tara:strand:+ start:3290 stop:4267 length:978 start_codon:yes stop_codon:yes gene_type:complete
MTPFEYATMGSGQIYFSQHGTYKQPQPRLQPRPQRQRQKGEPVSLQHLCLGVISKEVSFRAVDAARVCELLEGMGKDVTECKDYVHIRKRLDHLFQTQQRKEAAEKAEKARLREEEEAMRRAKEADAQQERWEEAEAETSEWRQRQNKEAFAAREAARRAQEQETLRNASPTPISLSQILRRGTSGPASGTSTVQTHGAAPAPSQRSPPKRQLTNPFAAQQPPSKRPAPLPTAIHCPEPVVEPAPTASRPMPRAAPSMKRASTAASRGTRKQRVPWSAREERALRDALKQGMHGQWEEILRRPEWSDALSRRTGENLKDKARILK